VAHDKPEINIGANHISLNQAKGNYGDFGVSEKKFKDSVREPYNEEYPENNLPR
jgi:hypothetical protein